MSSRFVPPYVDHDGSIDSVYVHAQLVASPPSESREHAKRHTPSIPIELIVIIFEYLDITTLLTRCRQVCFISVLKFDSNELYKTLSSQICHALRDIIDSSASIQYRIELAVAGMDDGPPSSLGPAQRLGTPLVHCFAGLD
jgi:hypothetical protein